MEMGRERAKKRMGVYSIGQMHFGLKKGEILLKELHLEVLMMGRKIWKDKNHPERLQVRKRE